MTKEYLFVVRLETLKADLLPAIEEMRTGRSIEGISRLLERVGKVFSTLPADAHIAQFGRGGFLLFCLELSFCRKFRRDRAITMARSEAIPELFEALCLEKIDHKNVFLDVASLRSVTWLSDNSASFSRIFRYGPRESLVPGEAFEAFPKPEVERLRTVLTESFVPSALDDRAKLVKLIDYVLSNPELALGLTVF